MEIAAGRMRIVLVLVCYAAAIFLVLHVAAGIDFWRAVLWALGAVVVSIVLAITAIFSL